MSPKEQAERRRRERIEKLYLAVKAQRPDLYQQAVQIGHLALTEFGGADELKRSAMVEAAAMDLAAQAAGIVL